MAGRDFKRPAGLALALGLALAFAGGGALALSAEQTVKARQESFKALGGAFKTINDGLKADQPNLPGIAAAAGRMLALSQTVPGLFPKASGPETGAKMRAKAEIWTDPAGFAAAAQGLQAETAKLQSLALAGDVEAVRAQVRATGGACRTCHTKFRAEEQR